MQTTKNGFDAKAFAVRFKSNSEQLISFISWGDKAQWLTEYNQRILESFVSSSHFSSFNDEKKVQLIATHADIMFALNLLFGIVTDDVIEYSSEARSLIESIKFSK